ncbi:UNVERIFIED_CONTAM: hypothetical protein FKN15_065552 [Acipenser sinensis]
MLLDCLALPGSPGERNCPRPFRAFFPVSNQSAASHNDCRALQPLVPYGYPGHTFGLPQQTQQNPSAGGSQAPQQQGPTGPVSIEIVIACDG